MKTQKKLTVIALADTVVWIKNHPLCDEIPEVFLTRGLYVHQRWQTVRLVFLRRDLDRAYKHRVRKLVPNPLHARR